MPRRLTTWCAWSLSLGVLALLAAYCTWAVLSDAPIWQFVTHLYADKQFLKHTLREHGVLAPIIFVGVQALQVVISPIPGDVAGILGGYLFGEWRGLAYSTLGLTLGSTAAFGVGRLLGTHTFKNLVSEQVWHKLGFIVEAEGAILCFILFLLPGVPKDMACYLFGLSPMPFWIFAVVSTLGRIPTTWDCRPRGPIRRRASTSARFCSRPSWSQGRCRSTAIAPGLSPAFGACRSRTSHDEGTHPAPGARRRPWLRRSW
jgi:uncharacterized membrane protein YdjX (TVP38/TMEM64 family)